MLNILGFAARSGLAMPLAAVLTAGVFLALASALSQPFATADKEDRTRLPLETVVTTERQGPTVTTIVEGEDFAKPREPKLDMCSLSATCPVMHVPANKWVNPDSKAQRPEMAPEIRVTPETPHRSVEFMAPRYPQECFEKEAEGAVTVAYDVMPEGQIVNVRIIKTADRCFNEEVIRIVRQARYRRTFEGEDLTRHNVQRTFTFKLAD